MMSAWNRWAVMDRGDRERCHHRGLGQTLATDHNAIFRLGWRPGPEAVKNCGTTVGAIKEGLTSCWIVRHRDFGDLIQHFEERTVVNGYIDLEHIVPKFVQSTGEVGHARLSN